MAAGQAPCNCMLWQVRPLFAPPVTACYDGVTCMQHIACSCRLHDLHYSIDLGFSDFQLLVERCSSTVQSSNYPDASVSLTSTQRLNIWLYYSYTAKLWYQHPDRGNQINLNWEGAGNTLELNAIVAGLILVQNAMVESLDPFK